MKHEMPRVPGGASGTRASTRWTMFVRQVVVAVGDEDLLAADPPRAVTGRDGTGPHGAEIRAGVRLGQVHRSRPLTSHQAGEVRLLAAPRWHGPGAARWRPASRSGRARTPGSRRPAAHRAPWRPARGTASAIVGREGHGPPACRDIALIGLDESVGRGDRAVGVAPAVLRVTDAVQRGDHLGGKPARPQRARPTAARARHARSTEWPSAQGDRRSRSARTRCPRGAAHTRYPEVPA